MGVGMGWHHNSSEGGITPCCCLHALTILHVVLIYTLHYTLHTCCIAWWHHAILLLTCAVSILLTHCAYNCTYLCTHYITLYVAHVVQHGGITPCCCLHALPVFCLHVVCIYTLHYITLYTLYYTTYIVYVGCKYTLNYFVFHTCCTAWCATMQLTCAACMSSCLICTMFAFMLFIFCTSTMRIKISQKCAALISHTVHMSL